MRDLERALTVTRQILDAFNTVKSTLQAVDRYDPTQWAARHLYSFFSGGNTGGGTNIQMPVTVHANGATDPMAIGNATAHGVRNAMEGIFNNQPNRSKTKHSWAAFGGRPERFRWPTFNGNAMDGGRRFSGERRYYSRFPYFTDRRDCYKR